MPLVQVTMLAGRTADQKRKLAVRITDAMVEEAGARREAVVVAFHEVSKESYASGGVLMAPLCDKNAGEGARATWSHMVSPGVRRDGLQRARQTSAILFLRTAESEVRRGGPQAPRRPCTAHR
jgi:4-oxalocrotonate tautomerase